MGTFYVLVKVLLLDFDLILDFDFLVVDLSFVSLSLDRSALELSLFVFSFCDSSFCRLTLSGFLSSISF